MNATNRLHENDGKEELFEPAAPPRAVNFRASTILTKIPGCKHRLELLDFRPTIPNEEADGDLS